MENYIGCSGYYYNHWKGLFYPEKLAKSKWLIYYSQHFNTVEINNTFYRMPEEKAVRHWYEITPVDFVFSVKGYRLITHLKKFTVDEILVDHLERFLHTVSYLKEKLGPVLWQLPGNFTVNVGKLEKFSSLLSPEFQHVFEFRSPTWFIPEVFEILSSHNHALCLVSTPRQYPEVPAPTSEITYIRFHGQGSWYNDNYPDEDLQNWKRKIEALPSKRLYAYFNNDINGYAINNGRYLASLFK